jgi:flagellar biosynthesis/type III secretory pathway ATPase
MVRGGGFTVPHYTSKQHSLVGKAPDPGEAGAWEKALRPRQVEIFEHIAGEVLSSLGYPLRYGKSAQKMTLKERVIANVQEIMKREVINKVRHWRRIRKGIARASKQPES